MQDSIPDFLSARRSNRAFWVGRGREAEKVVSTRRYFRGPSGPLLRRDKVCIAGIDANIEGAQAEGSRLAKAGMRNTLSMLLYRTTALAVLLLAGASVGAMGRIAVEAASQGRQAALFSPREWTGLVSQADLLGAAAIGASTLVIAGGLILWWRERRVSFFRSPSEVVHVLALPVLAVVPAIRTPREESARRRRIFWQTVVVVLLAVSVGYLLWWTRVMR